MKKIILFSLIACFGVMSFSYAERSRTCGPSTLGFDGNQDYNDNEFLYQTKEQYDLTKSGYESTGHQTSGRGVGWECDGTHSGSCSHGEKVTMPVGHYFEGQRINVAKEYVCDRTGFFGFKGDGWVPVEKSVKKCVTKWGDLNVGKTFEKKMTTIECSGMDYTEAKELGVEWEVVCRSENYVVCKPYKCIDGYKVNFTTGKCDKVCPDCDKKDPKAECEKQGKVWNSKTQKCEDKKKPEPKPNFCDQYKQWPKRHACCVAGKATKWEGADRSDNGTCVCVEKAKKWDGKKCVVAEDNSCETLYKGNDEAIACCNSSDATWNGNLKKCECNEENKNWKYDANTKKGQCVDIPRDNDEWSDCWFKLDVDITCKNSNNYYKRNDIRYLTKKEAQSIGCTGGQLFADVKIIDGIINDVKKADELINLVCGRSGGAFSPIATIPGGTPTVTPPVPSGMDIETAKSTLRRFFGEAKNNASVWKTEDGSFNTARLASDLTAGVVLGTVGGVVSANIIKKNQVKKGFEVLHCTIGGQTVADWGDQFNTSLRR